jgi:hypothetical protein
MSKPFTTSAYREQPMDIAFAKLGSRIERMPNRALWLAVFLPLFVLYFLTASTSLPYHIDPLTNVFTAWKLGTEGTVYLDEYAEVEGPDFYGVTNWLVRGRGRPVSKYPPGAAILAAPGYRIYGEAKETSVRFFNPSARSSITVRFLLPSLVPAAVAAALSVAVGLATLAVSIRPHTTTIRTLGGAATVGMGTGLWLVAADALWQHGPSIMWLALGLLALRSKRHLLAGAMFAIALLSRPQVAIIVAIVGLGVAWSERSQRVLFKIGGASAAGLGAYVLYNLAIFGSPLPHESGGYFLEAAVTNTVANTLSKLANALFDPSRGLLTMSPFLVTLLPGVPTAWRRAPSWMKWAALGGIVYFVLQIRANIWGGGLEHSYRYPLEMVIALAPLLAIAYQTWAAERTLARRVTIAASTFAIALHALSFVLVG